MSLVGRTALVTGASRGIGAACARALARAGASVVVGYRTGAAEAEAVVADIEAAGGTALAVAADVTDPGQVAAMVRQAEAAYGGVDILVASALHRFRFDPAGRSWSWEVPWEAYEEQWRSGVGAAWSAVRAVLPGMQARQWGRVVLLATDLVAQPTVPYAAYTTAKAALIGFARNLAAELGQFNVTVNCVAPGLIHPTGGSQPTPEGLKQRLAAATPLRRIGLPEDVADVVVFFASEASRFVTGQCLAVDGGLVMTGPGVTGS